jgi:hypothetical protein
MLAQVPTGALAVLLESSKKLVYKTPVPDDLLV